MDERQRLIDTLAPFIGHARAQTMVSDLEATVRAEASEGASEAATTVVKRGLIYSGVMGLALTGLTVYLSKRACTC